MEEDDDNHSFAPSKGLVLEDPAVTAPGTRVAKSKARAKKDRRIVKKALLAEAARANFSFFYPLVVSSLFQNRKPI
jgi:hypothetical protein